MWLDKVSKDLGLADPLQNIKSAYEAINSEKDHLEKRIKLSEARIKYTVSKKTPQIQTMIKIVSSLKSFQSVTDIFDIGGGRG